MSFQRRRTLALIVQPALICLAMTTAWLLRFDFDLPHPKLLLLSLPLLICCRWFSLSAFRLNRNHWRYTGLHDLRQISISVLLGTVLFVLLGRLTSLNRHYPDTVPGSVIVLEALISFLFLSGLRVVTRLVLTSAFARSRRDRKPILIVGAGDAAAQLVRALRSMRYLVLGMVDDDPSLWHTSIDGATVLGSIDALPELVGRHGAKEVLVAIPSASASQMLRITELCVQSGVPFRCVPGLLDLVKGRGAITDLRELNLDDLLGREPVTLDMSQVRTSLNGRVIMVTGGAGSIGSELCRQIAREGPARLICVDQSETPLFHLQQALSATSGVEILYSVADIVDTARMQQLILGYGVQVIFHAAAYKHVPLTEANVYEGLRNNVFSLIDLVEVAEQSGCEDFLFISSDKAVKPSSLMGCTKRLGELIISSRPQGRIRCVSVRFGNVLGSQGSVIPIFQRQLREGSEITVTHPEMTRYFMTIPEAVSLTLQAFTIGAHRDVLVLNMGEAVPILNLAKTVIRLSGCDETQVRIRYTGIRPGEKLHEELFYETEQQLPTPVHKVMRAQGSFPRWSVLLEQLEELERLAYHGDSYAIRCKVKHIIPEYQWAPVEEMPMLALAVGQ